MFEEFLIVFGFTILAASYLVHLACSSFHSGCPEGLPFDILNQTPLSSSWARLLIDPLNLNPSLILPIAHFGRYSYYLLILLFTYYTIKLNLSFLTNLLKLAVTLLLSFLILFAFAAISTKLQIPQDL